MIPIRDDVQAESAPIVNILLIVANVCAFIYTLSLPESIIHQWCVVPARFVAEHNLGQVATMFTSMFMHGGWAHLLGNMWFLWIFGDNVEDRMGHIEYLFFYLLCGMVGDVAQILVDPHSTQPSLGASGAIAGVMGAYLLLFPQARIRMMWEEAWFFQTTWPAWLVIGEWWALNFFMGAVLHDTSSHIGYLAHLGGFSAGLLLGLLFARKDGGSATDYRLDFEGYDEYRSRYR